MYSDPRRKDFEIQQDIERLDAANATSGTSLEELWRANQQQLDLYHQIATNQASKSFRNAQLAATVGFLVLVVSGVAAWLSKNEPFSWAGGVIGLSGAALGGYISNTFMGSQEQASKLMREYFRHPLVLSRTLFLERLIVQVPEDQRSRLLESLISSSHLDVVSDSSSEDE